MKSFRNLTWVWRYQQIHQLFPFSCGTKSKHGRLSEITFFDMNNVRWARDRRLSGAFRGRSAVVLGMLRYSMSDENSSVLSQTAVSCCDKNFKCFIVISTLSIGFGRTYLCSSKRRSRDRRLRLTCLDIACCQKWLLRMLYWLMRWRPVVRWFRWGSDVK